MKNVIWHPKAWNALLLFPRETQKELGKAIQDLQDGHMLSMPLSRPMPSIASGVSELRVRDRTGNYRMFYYLKSELGILVFHAFVKKSQKTPEKEVMLGKKRLKEMLRG